MSCQLRTLLTLCLLLPALLPEATAAARELRVATLITSAVTGPGSPEKTAESSATFQLNDLLAREVCRRLVATCKLEPLPFAEVIPGVAAGRYQFAVANVMHTKEREKSVLFSQKLWRSSSRLVGTPASIRQYQSDNRDIQLQALQEARLAVAGGSQQQQYASTLSSRNRLTLIEVPTASEALQAVLDKKADFALLPIRNAYFMLSQLPAGSAEFAGPAMTEHGLGGTTHMIVSPGEPALLGEIDTALDAMRKDGTYQRIVRRFMPFLDD